MFPDGADLTALQLLVPDAEPLVDAVRGLPGVGLLEPAHISLGYPWLPPSEAAAGLDLLRELARTTTSYDALLRGPRRFEPDPRGRVLVHVVPDPDGPLRELARRVGAAGVTPHLSVARVTADGDPDDVAARLAPLLPLTVRLASLELTVRARGTWTRVLRLDLAV